MPLATLFVLSRFRLRLSMLDYRKSTKPTQFPKRGGDHVPIFSELVLPCFVRLGIQQRLDLGSEGWYPLSAANEFHGLDGAIGLGAA